MQFTQYKVFEYFTEGSKVLILISINISLEYMLIKFIVHFVRKQNSSF